MQNDNATLRSSIPVTLELAGGARLSGSLTTTDVGNWQLSSARLVDPGEHESGKFIMPAEKSATLNLGSLRDDEGYIDNVAVTIVGASGSTLRLEFETRGGTIEQRCLALLGNGPKKRTSSKLISGHGGIEDRDALETLRHLSIAPLEKSLHDFFVELTNHLFDLSTVNKQITSGENLHYEAMNAVKKNSAVMSNLASHVIDENYLALAPGKKTQPSEPHMTQKVVNLDLVDLTEFEESLAIGRIITNGENRHSLLLECLTIRLAEVLGTDPQKLNLPVGIAQICKAFRLAIENQGIPHKALPDVFDFFGKQYIAKLEPFYASLNKLMLDRGICPGLEEEIRAGGSRLHRPGPVRKSPEPRAVPAKKALASELPRERTDELTQKLADQFSPDALYSSVIQALNFRRETQGLLPTGTDIRHPPQLGGSSNSSSAAQASISPEARSKIAGTPDERLADANAVAQILAQLQQDASKRAAVHQSPSLREYLAQNQGNIEGLQNTAGLSSESLNQLDLVDNMFGSIKSHLDVTEDLKPALGNLQIPMARLALQEPRFFLDRSHAARAVMDKLAQLTTSANFPNKALESRIHGVIESIVSNYDSDSTVFDTALIDIEKLVAQQERALTRNVERVVRTQEGNQKLTQAQTAVNDIIASRITPPLAPEVLVNLVDSGWRDLLILTHIKEGPDSQAWFDHIKTLDLLSRWLGEQQEGEVDEEMLLQRGLEAEPLIDLIDQQISAALPTSVNHEAILNNLRSILAGREPIILCEVAAQGTSVAEPAQVRAKIEHLPRLRRWIRRVEELEKGCWLSYKDKSGQKRRMQLAWISESRDRYIFVNERGQKNADLSTVQLARQLGRGVQPPPRADKMSLIDRSMFDTLEHVQKSLSFAKNYDSLTRLINKKTFLDQLNRAHMHAQRKHAQHAVLYLNIDQFKLVNEIYDTVNGDQVLAEFAALLAQLHGRKSSSARLQEDEFAVLLLDRSMDQAVRYAEKIRGDIEASSVDIEGEKITFTVSIGVAPIVEHSPGIEEILESAQEAMRLAKKQGRNCVVQFHEDEEQAQSYQSLQAKTRAEIKHTIETDQFVLRAQPIVQTLIQSGSPSSEHFELLLSLKEADGTLTSPQDFIDGAERFGYMTLVDRWVVKEAFKWISHLIDSQKIVPHISVNLSGTSVTDDAFMEYLLEQISEFGVGTNRLCFEITETGTISNLVKAADFVRTFRNIGCKFSIDDFGTGLASHNYLRELPVDYVKIDGTFITNIHENRNDYAMARSINDLAHFLGQETIAESVENDSIIHCLREIGVDYLQGWGVGKPKILAEVTEELGSIEK